MRLLEALLFILFFSEAAWSRTRLAGVGSTESTRQRRRQTSCKFARMGLAAVALVALAAQECSGLQFSGHMASRSPVFASHLALSPAVRKTLSSHPPITTLSVPGARGSTPLRINWVLARFLMVVLRAERGRGIFEVPSGTPKRRQNHPSSAYPTVRRCKTYARTDLC
jgi:hypothetical protein